LNPTWIYDWETQKFTSKERDAETGLDYFEARYFSSAQGRFMSPDPGNAGAFASNPQSWNAYSYVINNPLKYTDPRGLDCVYASNFSTTGTVGVERGDCSQKGGTFVEGTIDTNSLTYNKGNNSIGYSYTSGDAGGVGTIGLPAAPDTPDPGLQALQRAGQIAGPVGDARFIGGFYAASALAGFALYSGGAFANVGPQLIPGLAPSGEYTGTIRALDALGETNPGAVLNSTQSRALAQNVVDVLNKTIPNAEARGTEAFVQAVRNQLANPRFQFLNQIPCPLKEALVQGAARLGIIVK
jgi:RHS repeat-associated protein